MSGTSEVPPVATVTFVNERNGEMAEDVCGIWPQEEHQFGCELVQQLVNDYDPTISRRQLIVRCVQFDEDATRWGVAPMVYAEDQSTNGTTLVRDYQDGEGKMCPQSCFLSKSLGPVLLRHGDRLYFSNTTSMIYRETKPVDNSRMDFVMSLETQQLPKTISVDSRLIGAGGQGKVFIAWDHETGDQVACKAVPLGGVALNRKLVDKDTSQLNTKDVSARNMLSYKPKTRPAKLLDKIHRLEVEYDVLKDLSHPNIIDMRKVFITSHHIYIIQELMTGGDLFSFTNYKGGKLSDPLTAVITRQLLKAVEYLHTNGIVHRDIKPDNILMTSWKDTARIVLTDFGLAKRIGKFKNPASQYAARFRMFSTCGTEGFAAPEVHKLNPTIEATKGYSSAIDMWSVGTVTALMLTGNLAFGNANSEGGIGQVTSRTQSAYDVSVIDRGEEGWEGIIRRARDFVKSLLVLDERKRLTAKQALEHKWFTNHTCAAHFEAVYKHAIREWKPRVTDKQNVVIEIDTSDILVPEPVASKAMRGSSASAIIHSKFFGDPHTASHQGDKMRSSTGHTAATGESQEESVIPESEDAVVVPESSQSRLKPSIAYANKQPSLEFPWPSPMRSRQPSHNPSQPTLTRLFRKPNRMPSTWRRLGQNLHASEPDISTSLPPSSGEDLDALKPPNSFKRTSAAVGPSPEFPWPSSPPNSRKRREPSFEFPWPSQPRAKQKV